MTHGKNVNCHDRWGSTPLNDAIRNHHDPVAQLLRKHGGKEGANDYQQFDDVTIPISVTSDVTAFIWASSKGNLDAMLPYVARGVSLDSAGYDARTALHLAASEGYLSVVRYLLANYANVNPLDRRSQTPLDDAIRHGHSNSNVEAILREAGAVECTAS